MSNSHLIVIGSGIAGLYGALLAAESGMRVSLMTKGTLGQSNTHFAQGGICAVLDPGQCAPGDSVEAHIADTLKAGAGQCNPDAVTVLCSEAAGDIASLERFGVIFDRDAATGSRALGLEGAHSAARILHAGGDATGAAIAEGLISAVLDAAALGLITLMEHCLVTELLTQIPASASAAGDLAPERNPEADDAGTSPRAVIAGVAYLAPDDDAVDERRVLAADAVLLAAGGAGQLFDVTTNPLSATGDALALAWRSGAVVGDLEYFQFHPTALAMGGNFLISEAVRGAGAVLRDAHGEQFMKRYHPEGDLAPRDVVSRGITEHLRGSTEAVPSVYLDATGVEEAHGQGYLARRFPTIAAETTALGLDWRQEWLPVAPAAHYWMGGVATDLHGRTSVPGLYAAGEAACTGVHGANRLASNSLLEGLVFSRRAVAAFTASMSTKITRLTRDVHRWPLLDVDARPMQGAPGPLAPDSASPGLSRTDLRHIMGAQAGVVRDAAGLADAAAVLAASSSSFGTARQGQGQGQGREAAEDQNLHLIATLLVHAALARENSVGAHFRHDFPQSPAAAGTRNSHFWRDPDPPQLPAADFSTAPTQRESERV